MFCPSCGTPNKDDVSFCRSCGANLSLVPQALTGQLPQQPTARPDKKGRHQSRTPSLQNGIQQAFVGIGFLFVSLACLLFAPAGRIWWFWLLIPAFTMLGKGISEIVAARQQQLPFQQPQSHFPPPQQPQQVIPPVPPAVGYQAPKTGDLAKPPTSVTEGTTKLFE
jgi:hypothetical protein